MPLGTPVILAPAAELLVEVEGCCTVTRLSVCEPFGYDVEERSIETDGGAYESDDDPSLGRVVGFPELVSPGDPAVVV